MSERAFASIGVTEDDLVTGEAVALDLPPASIGLRMLSGLLDFLVVQTLATALVTFAAFLSANFDEAVVAAMILLATVTALLGFPVTFETISRGRTLGKLATGLRTVRDDAGPITFRHALARGLIGVVEVYILWGIPATIASAVSSRGKRLGDIAAGTYVVRERVSAVLAPPVPMPAHLQQWAMTADMVRLPDGLAMAVRTFLPAAFTMDPGAREQLGRQLLDEVLLHVSPAPPPGNHPEYVLAAVLADRRRRDLDRLLRDAALRDRLVPGDPAT